MKNELIVALFASLILLGLYHSTQSREPSSWTSWKAQYGVNLAPEEEIYRKFIFEKNLLTIEKHNSDQSQTYKMGVNQFTIYTTEEFADIFLTPMVMPSEHQLGKTPVKMDDIDWSAQGKVSNIVKNQGSCGACWAFSATNVVESWLLFQDINVSLSEQQLVDCSGSQGNQGCNGGWPSNALNYIKTYGITTEDAYPYVARSSGCKMQGGPYKIHGTTSYSGCNGLTNGIKSHPISVTVDATNWSTYKSGVFSNCSTNINHAVLLVGVVGGNWKIKNSWGPKWGENGYIRLSGLTNTCGICAYSGVFPN